MSRKQELETPESDLRRLVAGIPTQSFGFDPSPVYAGFVVDKKELGHVYIRILRCPPVNIIPPMLHTDLSPTLHVLASDNVVKQHI